MTTTTHGRDQILSYAKLGAKKDGTITGLHVRIVADLGAYYQLLTPFIPSFAAFVMSGCYKIPAVQTDIVGRLHEQVRHRRGTRRRQARGHPPDRGDARPGRGRARHRPRGDAAEELHPQGGLPGRGRDRRDLRLRRLPRHARPAARARGPRRLPQGAGRAARTGRAPRHRLLHLRGDLRRGAVARGRARAASGCRAASGSPPSCACTRRARPPSTPAARRTGRATRPASRRSWRTGSASIRSRSR